MALAVSAWRDSRARRQRMCSALYLNAKQRLFERMSLNYAAGSSPSFRDHVLAHHRRPAEIERGDNKAAVIKAVRGDWVPIDEICELYSVSVDEFVAWERDIDGYGIHGLRTTRYQIYRDTHGPA